MPKPILYSSWSSGCSTRVRVALALKKVDYDYRPINLRSDEKEDPEFVKYNPAKKVPILIINGLILTESLAIIEYLDECYPDPPLFPKDLEKKTYARSIALHIACNIQPLQNMAVAKILNEKISGYGEEWCQLHINRGFVALEELLRKYSGKFCVGDEITVADVTLPSIVYNAIKKYNVDMSAYPKIVEITARLAAIPEFQAANPENQPDAPKN